MSKTYHIYLNDKCLFKELNEDEFDVVWGRLYHSYYKEELTYSEIINEEGQGVLFEASY